MTATAATETINISGTGTLTLGNITADDQIGNTAYKGAFLAAALAIIRDVDSPFKERALVSLAALEIGELKLGWCRKKKAA
jgi:hypothetical protein